MRAVSVCHWLPAHHMTAFPAGFLLDKKIGVNQPKRLENANILISNTGMDTDKIKVCAHAHTHPVVVAVRTDGSAVWFQIFGSRVRVDSTAKVAEIELAEKEKMKEKVDRILKHGINCFINRYRLAASPRPLTFDTGHVHGLNLCGPRQTAHLQLPGAAVRSGRRHGDRTCRLCRRGASGSGHRCVNTRHSTTC